MRMILIIVDRDDDIDINDLVIKMLLMSDEDPTHLLLQAASVGEWHHGYHVGNDVLCVCNGNGVELDDPLNFSSRLPQWVSGTSTRRAMSGLKTTISKCNVFQNETKLNSIS